MNKEKMALYVAHNPALALKTALKVLQVKFGGLDKAKLTPTVVRNDSVTWHNDFKCQVCDRYLGERYLQENCQIGSCPGCAEWFAPEGRKIFTTALKGNYYRSGDMEVGYVIDKYLRMDDVFLDIGTCIGYFTALALAICGRKGRVISFEPMTLFLQNMAFIKDRNPEANWTFENVAVSEKRGEATLMVPKHFHLSSGFLGNDSETYRDFLGDLTPMKITTVALADYFGEGQRCNFIKLDVEGHEPVILASILKLFGRSTSRPHVVFEHEARNYSQDQLNDLHRLMGDFSREGWDVLHAGTEHNALDDFSKTSIRIHIHLRPC